VLISSSCWLIWAAVVLPAALSQSSDWAACVLLACVHHCFDLIHFLDVLWNWFGTQVLCTQVFIRTVTMLGQFTLNDANGKIIAKIWE
jgi:hypothetical protein